MLRRSQAEDLLAYARCVLVVEMVLPLFRAHVSCRLGIGIKNRNALCTEA